VEVEITPGVTLLAHTTAEVLFYFREDFNAREVGPRLSITGLDRLKALSRYRTSMRLAKIAPAKEAA
jgi:hypothetical protein